MSNSITVEAQERPELGKNANRRLRKVGGVPGVVYGLDRPPFPVGVGARKIEEVLGLETGRNTIFTLALTGQDRSRAVMIKALQRDPRMSFAVANPMAGWASAFGCQLFGNAELLEPHSADWEHGMTVFKYPSSNWEVGRPIDTVPQGLLLRLRPDRITLTEHFLRREGYAARQFWDRDPAKAKARTATV